MVIEPANGGINEKNAFGYKNTDNKNIAHSKTFQKFY